MPGGQSDRSQTGIGSKYKTGSSAGCISKKSQGQIFLKIYNLLRNLNLAKEP